MSQRPRDIGRKYKVTGSQKKPSAKAKTDRTRKNKGALDKY